MLFEVLEGEIIIIESYTLERQNGSLSFIKEGKEIDWRWILNNPSWDWIKEKGRWSRLRKQDEWFLSKFGFKDLFSEFDVNYINITEEIWNGRILDKKIVKEMVENKYPPVHNKEIYGFFPKKLYKYKNGVFINLGKVKGIKGTYPSLTLKNTFGLIPDPLRSWWHGPDDKHLSSNIIDINKLYHTFFDVFGICEAINAATVSNPHGSIEVPWGHYDILKSLRFASSSKNLVSLDSLMCVLMDIDPFDVEYIKLGQKCFGKVNKKDLKLARKIVNKFLKIYRE